MQCHLDRAAGVVSRRRETGDGLGVEAAVGGERADHHTGGAGDDHGSHLGGHQGGLLGVVDEVARSAADQYLDRQAHGGDRLHQGGRRGQTAQLQTGAEFDAIGSVVEGGPGSGR